MMFRAAFLVVLPCKLIVDNQFTRQYNPEDSSEHHTCRRENLKSQKIKRINTSIYLISGQNYNINIDNKKSYGNMAKLRYLGIIVTHVNNIHERIKSNLVF
jgi:hypothetical protein